MLRTRRRAVLTWHLLSDAAATLAAFLLAYCGAGVALERLAGMRVVLPLKDYLWVPLLSVPMWWALFAFAGAYRLERVQTPLETARRLLPPMLLGALVIGFAIFALQEKDFSRRVIGAFLVANFLLAVLGRCGLAAWLRRLGPLRDLLLIGTTEGAAAWAARLPRAEWGLRPVGLLADGGADPAQGLPLLGRPEDLPRVLEERVVDDVIVTDAGVGMETVQRVIRTCETVGVDVHLAEGFFDAPASRMHVQTLENRRLLTFRRGPYDPAPLALKRALDVALAAGVLWFFWPMFLALALGVRLTSRGPAFYRQTRVGLNGRRFTLYKFRSMHEGSHERRTALAGSNIYKGPVFKMRRDPRVTSFGRLLRRYSLDELPQFWNVLRGDMSLVGPRPALPEEVKQYERWQRRRLSMRPGLTGLWQVSERYEMSFPQWMEYDLRYIDTWSLASDVAILLRTLPVVLRGGGL